MAVRRDAPFDLARHLVGPRRARPGSPVDAPAVVTAETVLAIGIEPEAAAQGVKGRGRHAFQHAAPASQAHVGRVERHPLHDDEARAELAGEHDRAVATVQDQAGIAVDDERPGQGARGAKQRGHS